MAKHGSGLVSRMRRLVVDAVGFARLPFRMTRHAMRLPQVRGGFRVLFYCVGCLVVVALFGLRSAKGSMGEHGLVMGRQLSQLEDLTAAPTVLLLNGERIHIASATVAGSIESLLDRFENVCKADAATGVEFTDPKLVEKMKSLPESFRMGIVREDGFADGVVGCVMKRPEHGDRSLTERMKRLVKNQDFGELGLFRYAYVKQSTPGRVQVITIWTDGSFKFNSMVPPAAGGDTPGSDLAGAARPPEAVRYLTAEAVGVPHSVRVYESKAKPRKVLEHYDHKMARLGWERLEKVDAELRTSRYYVRKGVELLVSAQESDGRVSVTMVETRAR